MTSIFRKTGLLLAGAATLVACRKDDPKSLEGPVPVPTFTVSLNTTQFPVTATFTSTTTDAFLYQWDFGDGSPLASGATVTHTYTSADTYRVKLTAAGKGGQGVSPQQAVEIPSPCGNAAYGILTACAKSGAATFALSDQPGAIQLKAADGTVLSSSGTLLPCQLDDRFSFTSSYTYSYAAAGSTVSNGRCGKDLSVNSNYLFRPSGDLGQLVLLAKGAFIGTADSVVNKTYDIVSATPTQLVLSGTLPNGNKVVTTYLLQLSELDRAKLLLTGGSSRTWMLNNTIDHPITVGTDGAPTSYFGGVSAGGLPACQADDQYTFTDDGKFSYDAKDQTFVALPNNQFDCLAPRTDLNSTYTFGPAVGAGKAQITLGKAGNFIGVTNAQDTRIYRIMEITDTTMVLRAGNPSADPLFVLNLHRKP